MKRKHKEEIIRWANSPRSTRVWYRGIRFHWYPLANPTWSEASHYIVDDEFAEIRKQFIDDYSKIQTVIEGVWEKVKSHIYHNSLENFTKMLEANPTKYRIEPTTETRWQWLCKDDENNYKVTTSRYKTIEEAQEARVTDRWKIIRKIEESKKEFEV